MISNFFPLQAQVFIQQTEDGFNGKAATYVVYGSEGLSNRIPYDKIKGTPFWSDEYKLAVLYSGNNRVSIRPVKLNLATNEIYFLKNDEELVLENVDVTKLIFYKGKDTSEIITSFIRRVPDLFLWNKKTDDFVQVLNQGKYQLLKHTKRIVGNADSLFGTQKRYFFKDEHNYFLRVNDKVEKVKKLNEEYILSLMPSSSNYKVWIKGNNISFKKEDDVIRFLNYYNSQASSAANK
ncbi:MAG: hypothetical protein M3352_01260 [Bacteroidota bacterium]|nr:hypothetical protein [Bacteroidota bacterium]